jgi:hypothetical protein
MHTKIVASVSARFHETFSLFSERRNKAMSHYDTIMLIVRFLLLRTI